MIELKQAMALGGIDLKQAIALGGDRFKAGDRTPNINTLVSCDRTYDDRFKVCDRTLDIE